MPPQLAVDPHLEHTVPLAHRVGPDVDLVAIPVSGLLVFHRALVLGIPLAAPAVVRVRMIGVQSPKELAASRATPVVLSPERKFVVTIGLDACLVFAGVRDGVDAVVFRRLASPPVAGLILSIPAHVDLVNPREAHDRDAGWLGRSRQLLVQERPRARVRFVPAPLWPCRWIRSAQVHHLCVGREVSAGPVCRVEAGRVNHRWVISDTHVVRVKGRDLSHCCSGNRQHNRAQQEDQEANSNRPPSGWRETSDQPAHHSHRVTHVPYAPARNTDQRSAECFERSD